MRRWTLLLLTMLLSVAALPAWAQHQHHRPSTDSTAPTPWSSLDSDARQMLAPLESKWSGMSPRHQQRLIDKARHWEKLPQSRRQAIRERIRRWQTMSPAERQRTRENRRLYHRLSRHERKQLHDAYQRFQRLPPAQRDRVLKQWHHMDPRQRRQWIEQHVPPRQPPNATDGSP